MDHYCKKVIAGKKLVLKRYISAAIYGNKTSGYAHGQHFVGGGTFENKREEGSGAFSKVWSHKHNLLSERLGMELLQSAVS